ncbi:MAG: STAS domain-containing protein, partial [bacterium]
RIEMKNNDEIQLGGRFDAAQVGKANEVFDQVASSCVVDFKNLEYISSAGLGILLKTQKRLHKSGHALRLINLNKHINDVFHYAGFNAIFEIGSSNS